MVTKHSNALAWDWGASFVQTTKTNMYLYSSITISARLRMVSEVFWLQKTNAVLGNMEW